MHSKNAQCIGIFVMVCIAWFVDTNFVFGASANDTVSPVQLSVSATLSISCDASVSMNAISGYGQSASTSQNEVTCNVRTNNSSGYKMEWQSSAATMTSGGDTIGAYTPAIVGTTELWSVSSADSEWGAKLSSGSEIYGASEQSAWGTGDTYASDKWLNVNNTAAYQFFSRSVESSSDGDDQKIRFGAEVGSSKLQPSGTYSVDVTITATTL